MEAFEFALSLLEQGDLADGAQGEKRVSPTSPAPETLYPRVHFSACLCPAGRTAVGAAQHVIALSGRLLLRV
jgi:hypothetical protein